MKQNRKTRKEPALPWHLWEDRESHDDDLDRAYNELEHTLNTMPTISELVITSTIKLFDH